MNPLCLRALARVFWVVTVLAGLALPAVADEIPVGADTSGNFHALADVNGDGFADLIYTVPATCNVPQPNVYVQYSNGTSFGAPVIVATDSIVVPVGCKDSTHYQAQAI